MSQDNLGRMERVDLRDVWQNEAGNFTPWLAKEDNLLLIGDTIGLELELEAQEKNVGPFRADLLCKDTATDSWVLIENQLEKTDHTHLGQLLTYAAGLSAVTIVWIAKHFQDDHRAALDWLNESTGSNINFFGLEIELWQIGDSQAAPRFNVVSQPNDWVKSLASAARSATEELSPLQRLQLEYWTRLREYMLEKGTRVDPRQPPAGRWMTFAVGRAGFSIAASSIFKDGRIAVGLVTSGSDAKDHFKVLESEREEIESEVGEAFDWQEQPNRKESRILLYHPHADPNDRSDWERQHAWIAQQLEKFDSVFRKRVKNIDLQDYEDDLYVEPEE